MNFTSFGNNQWPAASCHYAAHGADVQTFMRSDASGINYYETEMNGDGIMVMMMACHALTDADGCDSFLLGRLQIFMNNHFTFDIILPRRHRADAQAQV